MSRRATENRRHRVIELAADGITYAEIGAHVGLTRQRVHQILAAEGMTGGGARWHRVRIARARVERAEADLARARAWLAQCEAATEAERGAT